MFPGVLMRSGGRHTLSASTCALISNFYLWSLVPRFSVMRAPGVLRQANEGQKERDLWGENGCSLSFHLPCPPERSAPSELCKIKTCIFFPHVCSGSLMDTKKKEFMGRKGDVSVSFHLIFFSLHLFFFISLSLLPSLTSLFLFSAH